MHDNVRVGNLGADEINLGLHDRDIFVRAALQNVFLPDLREIVESAGVDPDVQGKNRAQRRENFLRLPTLALLIDDIALQKDAAAHGKLRHSLRAKRSIGDFAQRDAESFRDSLQESAVAGGALRIQPEIADRAIFQNHDLDVDPANVADAIGVREIMESSGGVSDRFNHSAIGAKNSFQQIFSVARNSERKNFSVADRFTKLAEQATGILNGIALAQRVTREQQLFVRREAHGLGSGRAEIAADHNAIESFLRSPYVHRFRMAISIGGRIHFRIQIDEFLGFLVPIAKSAAPLLLFLFVMAFFDPPVQFLYPLIDTHPRRLSQTYFDTTQRRVIQRILRHVDKGLRISPRRQFDFSFFPDVREMQPPSLLQTLEKQIGPAQEQNFRRRRISASQSCKILINDGLKKRSDDLVNGHAGLQQSIRVGFRENAALAADLMQGVSGVAHFGKLFRRNLQFAGRLFNEGSRPARAGALHQDLFALCFGIAVEKDRFHVFPADFAHEMHGRVKFFNAGGDRHNFLNYFSTGKRCNQSRAGAIKENAVVFRSQAMLVF